MCNEPARGTPGPWRGIFVQGPAVATATKVQRAQGWGAWPTCFGRAGASGSAPAAPSTGTAGSATSNGTGKSAGSAPAKAPSRSVGHPDRSVSRGDYAVRQGDSLSGIASRHGTTWRRAYAANRDMIGGDPNLIVPGQRLDL